MSGATLIRARGGEIIGDAPDRRVEILGEHDGMHATWSRFGPGRDGADPHVHRRHHDIFYVLAGELTLKLADGERAAPAGTLVRVPPMVVHGFRNGGAEEVRYLNVHAPGTGFADYMRALRDGGPRNFDQEDPPADGTRPSSEIVVGGPEIVFDEPDLRIALLTDVEAIGISETRAAPGGPPVRAHVHRHHAEAFYVLEGEVTVITGGRDLRAGPEDWVGLPPGLPHGVALTGPGPVRFLNLHAPGRGSGAFIRALRETGGDPEQAAARAPFDEEEA